MDDKKINEDSILNQDQIDKMLDHDNDRYLTEEDRKNCEALTIPENKQETADRAEEDRWYHPYLHDTNLVLQITREELEAYSGNCLSDNQWNHIKVCQKICEKCRGSRIEVELLVEEEILHVLKTTCRQCSHETHIILDDLL